MGDLFGLAFALHRHVSAYRRYPVGLAAGGMNLGIDNAWPHRVDPHTFVRHFPGEADGEGVDRALGGGIVDIFARRTELEAADDIFTMAPPRPS